MPRLHVSFLFCLSYFSMATSQLLTGYYQIISGHLNFAIPAGSKEANLILSFDQEGQYSWAEEYRREEEQKHEVIRTGPVEAFGKTVEGKVIKEQIRFNMFGEGVDTQIILRLIPKEDANKARGAYSFAFKYDNEDDSLIHQLKKNNLISHLAYSISYADSFKAGFVYFGGIHERATMNRKSFSCAVDPNYSTWGCQLTQVVINSKKEGPIAYDNTERGYFQAAEDNVYVPKSFYAFFNETVLKPYLEKGYCDVEKEVVTCSKSAIEKMPDVIFGFGSKGVTVKMKNLFESNAFKNSNKCLLRYKEDSNVWVFGSQFMKQFSMLFDYENKTITFYALDGIEDMKELMSGVDLRVVLGMIVAVAMFIGVTMMIILKQIKGKEDKAVTKRRSRLISSS